MGTRALQMHARDAAGLFAGASSTAAYAFARKAGKAVLSPDLKLEKIDTGSDTADGHVDGAAAWRSANPRTSFLSSPAAACAALAKPLLLSAACTVVTAYATSISVAACGVDANDEGVHVNVLPRALTRERGWLCVTSNHLLFVPHSTPAEGRHRRTGSNSSLPRRSSTRGVTATNGALGFGTAGLGFDIGVLHQLQLSPLQLEDVVSV